MKVQVGRRGNAIRWKLSERFGKFQLLCFVSPKDNHSLVFSSFSVCVEDAELPISTIYKNVESKRHLGFPFNKKLRANLKLIFFHLAYGTLYVI